MKNSKKISGTDLVCMNCGFVATIQRRNMRLKKLGHIKHMYCSNCMSIQSHYEVRDVNAFMWGCYNRGINNLNDDMRIVFDFLSERVDDSVKREDRVCKKILTKR